MRKGNQQLCQDSLRGCGIVSFVGDFPQSEKVRIQIDMADDHGGEQIVCVEQMIDQCTAHIDPDLDKGILRGGAIAMFRKTAQEVGVSSVQLVMLARGVDGAAPAQNIFEHIRVCTGAAVNVIGGVSVCDAAHLDAQYVCL